MEDLQFCHEWAEKLAARHPEDLSLSDHAALRQHLSECVQCANAYTTFNAVEAHIRALPKAAPLPSLVPQLMQTAQNQMSRVEIAELTIEDAVSHTLLDLFGEGTVDEVTIRFSPNSDAGLRQYSIYIRVQCSCQFFVLLPRTKENMKIAVEKSICSTLKELFGSISSANVTWDYQYDSLQCETM